MHISHQRHAAAFAVENAAHLSQCLGLTHTLGGDAHQFATGLTDEQCLTGCGGGIEARRVGHGLQPDGVEAANAYVADFYGAGDAPSVIVSHLAVGF